MKIIWKSFVCILIYYIIYISVSQRFRLKFILTNVITRKRIFVKINIIMQFEYRKLITGKVRFVQFWINWHLFRFKYSTIKTCFPQKFTYFLSWFIALSYRTRGKFGQLWYDVKIDKMLYQRERYLELSYMFINEPKRNRYFAV